MTVAYIWFCFNVASRFILGPLTPMIKTNIPTMKEIVGMIFFNCVCLLPETIESKISAFAYLIATWRFLSRINKKTTINTMGIIISHKYIGSVNFIISPFGLVACRKQKHAQNLFQNHRVYRSLYV